MGADLAYIGSAFIATEEPNANSDYKQMIVDSQAEDIVYTNLFTGVHGNYLRPSIVRAGLDQDNLPLSNPSAMDFGAPSEGSNAKPWRDIWGSGQGIGSVSEVVPAAISSRGCRPNIRLPESAWCTVQATLRRRREGVDRVSDFGIVAVTRSGAGGTGGASATDAPGPGSTRTSRGLTGWRQTEQTRTGSKLWPQVR
jgi:hypothetical protein